MLQHLVMLTFNEDVTDARRDAIVERLRLLPDQIPGLEKIEVRVDGGLVEDNAAVFFQMTFVDEYSWRAYTPHPAHVALARDLILPVLKAKTAVQYWS